MEIGSAVCVESSGPAAGEGAFERCCRQMRPRALKFAVGMIPDRDRAEDLLQEALLRLHAARARCAQDPEDLRRFLFRILANLCLDDLRRARSGRKALDEALPRERSRRETGQREPAAELAGRERAEAVRRALLALPPAERAALLLRELDGQSYARIARSLRTTVTNVTNLIHRARSRFVALARPWMEE